MMKNRYIILLTLALLLINSITITHAEIKVPKKLWSYTTGGPILAISPISDVTGDGKPDVVVGSKDYNVYLFDGASGQKVWTYLTKAEVSVLIPLKDVSGDGLPDVIAAAGCTIYALNGANGIKLWSSDLKHQIVYATLDYDQNVVVASCYDAEFEFKKLNRLSGEPIWNFSYHIEPMKDPELSGPNYPFTLITDITGDNKVELIVGWILHHIMPGFWRNVIEIKAYSLNGSAIIPLWTNAIKELVLNSRVQDVFTTQDISGDNFPDIIMLVKREGNIYTKDDIVAIDGATGRTIWSLDDVHGLYYISASIPIQDVSGDGRPDILVSHNLNNLSLLEGASGKILWTINLGPWVTAIAQLELKTFLIGLKNGELRVIDNLGSTIWKFSIEGDIRILKAIDDIDGDGTSDILVGSDDGSVHLISGKPKYLSNLSIVAITPTPINKPIVVSGSLNPPQNVTIDLIYMSPDGSLFIRKVQTKLDGSFQDAFIPNKAGNWTVKAKWNGNTDCYGAESQILTFTAVLPITLRVKAVSQLLSIPIEGATVTIRRGLLEVSRGRTDSSGVFSESLAPGYEYSIDVSCGWDTKHTSIYLVNDKELSFTLFYYDSIGVLVLTTVSISAPIIKIAVKRRRLRNFRSSLLSTIVKEGRVRIEDLAEKFKIKPEDVNKFLHEFCSRGTIRGVFTRDRREFITEERLREELKKRLA
jgi:outer membrane protein assembly factor BamB